MDVRLARLDDNKAILEIYNEAVHNTTATFDTVDRTYEQQVQWFEKHGDMHPVLVAVLNDRVVGWASLNPYSDRLAYARTAEVSLYIHRDFRGQGIGKRLLNDVLEAGRNAGLHTVLSRIAEGNESSIRLHRQYGFGVVGTMKEVGFKFGRMLDVVMMQKML
ncbi:GNAT family N-acetyltransferase [Paenibacillus piri]|uniref:N-acetyltransferase family protein n=1 Tax=Paenibacillus piri TaxID=2547395 RepID=A0A4R5KLW2_9BACL|nr:GNAT family N-acetyltransferase [Paenibacillus piri]TDF95905.1 N-acetyltransferase family protein [Paenibacillus piri]